MLPSVFTEEVKQASSSLPLVSCIMPTNNRRRFVPQAIAYFMRQDYLRRELLILDDGEDSIEDLVPPDPHIRYIRLDKKMILGAKRNLACEMACGDMIAHWDDDDWIASHRLRYEVTELERRQADLCGAARQIYYDPATERAWLYEYPPRLRRWLAGNTLCYRKEFWKRNTFPEIAFGEDTLFIWTPTASNAVLLEDHTFYVGIIHPHNTCKKSVTGPWWCAIPPEQVHQIIHDDRSFYQAFNQDRLECRSTCP